MGECAWTGTFGRGVTVWVQERQRRGRMSPHVHGTGYGMASAAQNPSQRITRALAGRSGALRGRVVHVWHAMPRGASLQGVAIDACSRQLTLRALGKPLTAIGGGVRALWAYPPDCYGLRKCASCLFLLEAEGGAERAVRRRGWSLWYVRTSAASAGAFHSLPGGARVRDVVSGLHGSREGRNTPGEGHMMSMMMCDLGGALGQRFSARQLAQPPVHECRLMASAPSPPPGMSQ